MHVSPREARDLLLWEYEALVINWNEQHDPDPQPDPASVEDFKGTEMFFTDHPELLN